MYLYWISVITWNELLDMECIVQEHPKNNALFIEVRAALVISY